MIRPTLVALVLALAVAGGRAPRAEAAWCWPDCSSFGKLGAVTTTFNGCWYSYGEVCSGWNNWLVNGVKKTCYPYCNPFPYTTAQLLFGFENSLRIRGRVTYAADTYRIFPADVGMGGYLRAQVSYWPGPGRPDPSEINAAALA